MFMKGDVINYLKNFGVFKVGVADPRHGFEKALKGCHPRDVMENCNSVIVFALHVGLDYYATLDYHQKADVESRVFNIYRDWVSYQLANFLINRGYEAVVPHGFKDERNKIAKLSFKLAAFEAGLGVYGRSGIIITPEYGPRINIGVVLTDAHMKPDKPLKDFHPCRECDTCERLCPAKAISKEKPPPLSYNRKRCLNFINEIRRKTKGRIKLCGYCYNHCPEGELKKKVLKISRWKTIKDLNENERKSLLKSLK